MRVGDIKVEAIKLMFTNYGFDFSINELQTMLSDENYGSYIVNMNGAIARALDRIENACIVPLKRKELSLDDCVETRSFLRFDTSKIEDFFMLDRVTAEYDSGEYVGNVEYELEGDVLLLPNHKASYTILYYPTIKTIDENTQDTDEIWIPEKIARLIPYFIKGDLYQEEEPDLAADARNIFEASLDDFKVQNQSKQDYVHRTFRLQ